MSNESPTSALEILLSEVNSNQQLNVRKSEASKRMIALLRQKGALAYGIDGMYGGEYGLLGSSNPGTLFIQGTHPIPLESNNFVALRNPSTENSNVVSQLVVLQKESPDYLKTDQKPLAEASFNSVSFPEIEECYEHHLQALNVILEALDTALPTLFEGTRPPQLPRVSYYSSNVPAGQIIDLSSMERVPFEFYGH